MSPTGGGVYTHRRSKKGANQGNWTTMADGAVRMRRVAFPHGRVPVFPHAPRAFHTAEAGFDACLGGRSARLGRGQGDGVVEATLDQSLASLIAAARNEVGLNVLLLFSRDPTTFDTAQGFSMRLQYPVEEVRAALAGLTMGGVLQRSRQADAGGLTYYWLTDDPTVLSALSRLIETYRAGPAERRTLFRALFSRPGLRPGDRVAVDAEPSLA